MCNYYVTTYNTNKKDYEINCYLLFSMIPTNKNDVEPSAQWVSTDYEKISKLFEQLCQDNNVVAKFKGDDLLIAQNKN